MMFKRVLLASSPSSGSSLLSTVIDAIPCISCGPELGLFSHPLMYQDFPLFKQKFLSYYRKFFTSYLYDFVQAEEIGFNPHGLLDEANLSYYCHDLNSIHELIQSSNSWFDLFDTVLCPPDPCIECIVEKSPQNSYCAGEFLSSDNRNNKIIGIFRHPYETVYSLLNRGFTLKSAIGFWLNANVRLLSLCLSSQNCFLVSYTDLVLSPEQTIYNILDFLSLDSTTDFNMSDFNLTHSSRISNDRTLNSINSWSSNPSDGISSKPIFNWLPNLTSLQIASINQSQVYFKKRSYSVFEIYKKMCTISSRHHDFPSILTFFPKSYSSYFHEYYALNNLSYDPTPKSQANSYSEINIMLSGSSSHRFFKRTIKRLLKFYIEYLLCFITKGRSKLTTSPDCSERRSRLSILPDYRDL